MIENMGKKNIMVKNDQIVKVKTDREIKKKIKTALFDKLIKIDKVISVTIVGSFVDCDDLSGISDIDTIIICDYLDKDIFNKCVNSARDLDLEKCGVNNYELKINSTFGPLKFDKPKLAVIHLMIYDISGHINHVINSPFTCYDWQRSKDFVGLSLENIFPVGILQPRDFNEARRSTDNYLSDLKKKSITYREYDLINNHLVQKEKHAFFDKKHKGEFAYHIVKNLIINYFKLDNKKNILLSNDRIKNEIHRFFNDKKAKYHTEKFMIISKIKEKRQSNFPKNTVEWAEQFIEEFKNIIYYDWKDAIKLNFIRHFKTNLNDGSYLGQGRDPSLDEEKVLKIQTQSSEIIYSSPLKRCLQTANLFYRDNCIIKDDRLLEFNYGDAEGLTYDDLSSKYPRVISDWNNGKDPHFPNGENTGDVLNRLLFFMDDLSKKCHDEKEGPISIFTHNGILRCLIGNLFQIQKRDWFKIVIPHGIPLEVLYKNERFYPNISRSLLRKIFINIGIVK